MSRSFDLVAEKLTSEDIATLTESSVEQVDDANAENKIRLRAEVNVISDRLRRKLLDAYKKEWAAAANEGRLLEIRGNPDVADAIALRAAQMAFGGKALRLGPGDDQ